MVSVGLRTKKPSKASKEIQMENTPNNTPETAPAPAPAPVAAAPAPGAKMELPKTTGKTPGGWNRFAGYNPNDAKNRQGGRDKDRGQRKRG